MIELNGPLAVLPWTHIPAAFSYVEGLDFHTWEVSSSWRAKSPFSKDPWLVVYISDHLPFYSSPPYSQAWSIWIPGWWYLWKSSFIRWSFWWSRIDVRWSLLIIIYILSKTLTLTLSAFSPFYNKYYIIIPYADIFPSGILKGVSYRVDMYNLGCYQMIAYHLVINNLFWSNDIKIWFWSEKTEVSAGVL